MCLGSVEGQTEGHYYTPKKELGSLSPLTRGCLLRVSRREPCVSLPFNPPFEMGELASIGFPHRAYSLSAALAPLQRILKRFGAQTLLAVASHFFFSSPSSLALEPSVQTPPPPPPLLLGRRKL